MVCGIDVGEVTALGFIQDGNIVGVEVVRCPRSRPLYERYRNIIQGVREHLNTYEPPTVIIDVPGLFGRKAKGSMKGPSLKSLRTLYGEYAAVLAAIGGFIQDGYAGLLVEGLEPNTRFQYGVWNDIATKKFDTKVPRDQIPARKDKALEYCRRVWGRDVPNDHAADALVLADWRERRAPIARLLYRLEAPGATEPEHQGGKE